MILFLNGCVPKKADNPIGAGKNWPVYLGDNSCSQYSPLTEINTDNIDRLELAWEYHTGDDVSENRSQIQCNPIIIDGVLYGTSPKLKVFALNAATGVERKRRHGAVGGAVLLRQRHLQRLAEKINFGCRCLTESGIARLQRHIVVHPHQNPLAAQRKVLEPFNLT